MGEETGQPEAFEGLAVRELGGGGVPTSWNEITHRVIGSAMAVHSALGPGLPERMYERAFLHEVRERGLDVQQQVAVTVKYREVVIGELRLDLLIENLLVVELKAVDEVSPVHLAQLVAYLRAGRFPLGLLINLNVLRLKDGIFRRARQEAIVMRTKMGSGGLVG